MTKKSINVELHGFGVGLRPTHNYSPLIGAGGRIQNKFLLQKFYLKLIDTVSIDSRMSKASWGLI